MVFVHYLDLDLRESIANAISRYLLSMQSAFWAIEKKRLKTQRKEPKNKMKPNRNVTVTKTQEKHHSKILERAKEKYKVKV